MRPVARDGSLQSSFFWMSLNEFTERKKAQRTLGFLTNSGLKLHTCFCDQRIEQHQWCTAIHRKVSKSTETKQTQTHQKGLQSEVDYRSRIQIDIEEHWGHQLGSCWNSCLLRPYIHFHPVFTCRTPAFPLFQTKTSSHISFGKINAVGRSLCQMRVIPREGEENNTRRKWSPLQEKQCYQLGARSLNDLAFSNVF